MATYLVTGGAGFIGSHLVDSLLASGHGVRVLDDLSTGVAENLSRKAELLVGDITDQPVVRDAVDRIDGCFHLAAIASVERGRREWLRSHTVNLSGTIAVFEEVLRRQRLFGRILPVVYTSSAAVYGDPSEIPISEETRTAPVNAYGADKLGCELHAAAAGRVHDLSTVGLRFFNIYGPRQDPNSPYSGVISVFCRRMAEMLPVEIHGDGNQVRDFVYVDDAVRALRRAMQSTSAKPGAKVFNVCSGVGTTIRELGQAISRVGGVPFSPRFAPARIGDIRSSVGDPRRAAEQLEFFASTCLDDGLARTLVAVRCDDPAPRVLTA